MCQIPLNFISLVRRVLFEDFVYLTLKFCSTTTITVRSEKTIFTLERLTVSVAIVKTLSYAVSQSKRSCTEN